MIPVPELEQLGLKMVIFPGSIMLSVCTLAQRVLREIRTHGTTAGLLDDMVSVQDFFEIMGLKETLALADTWSQRPTMSP
jgi:2-methylisocitrate lyase-like PEP mutase family enzyme